jgi:hypothetical protein
MSPAETPRFLLQDHFILVHAHVCYLWLPTARQVDRHEIAATAYDVATRLEGHVADEVTAASAGSLGTLTTPHSPQSLASGAHHDAVRHQAAVVGEAVSVSNHIVVVGCVAVARVEVEDLQTSAGIKVTLGLHIG